MHKIVADLRRDGDFAALFRECLRDQLFTQAIAVSVSRVEQRDTEVECFVHERDRLALGKISPPTGRDRPETEPDLAHRQVSIPVSAKLHTRTLVGSAENVQRPTPNVQCSIRSLSSSTFGVGRWTFSAFACCKRLTAACFYRAWLDGESRLESADPGARSILIANRFLEVYPSGFTKGYPVGHFIDY
jgi:hypothetical protein